MLYFARMKQSRTIARSRHRAPVTHHVSHHFPAPLAIALSGAGVVVAILLSVYVFGTFVGSAPVVARSSKSLTLVQRVARHLVVDQAEQPTIATVQDPVALQKNDPSFYKDAEAGDRLLVWSDKAVLYSESKDIVLAVLPLRFGDQVGSVAPSASEQTKEIVAIEVRNGTRRVGLARSVVNFLKESGLFTGTFTAKDAYSKNYSQTMVIKMNDKELPKATSDLLSAFHATSVSALPAAERNAKGDFLVILGADYAK